MPLFRFNTYLLLIISKHDYYRDFLFTFQKRGRKFMGTGRMKMDVHLIKRTRHVGLAWAIKSKLEPALMAQMTYVNQWKIKKQFNANYQNAQPFLLQVNYFYF
jgi:hypothetical protein